MCLALERLASRTCGSNESNRAPARGRDTFAVCLTTSSLNDRVDSYNGYAVQSDLAQFEFIAAGKSSCCSHVPFLLLLLLLLLFFLFFSTMLFVPSSGRLSVLAALSRIYHGRPNPLVSLSLFRFLSFLLHFSFIERKTN